MRHTAIPITGSTNNPGNVMASGPSPIDNRRDHNGIGFLNAGFRINNDQPDPDCPRPWRTRWRPPPQLKATLLNVGHYRPGERGHSADGYCRVPGSRSHPFHKRAYSSVSGRRFLNFGSVATATNLRNPPTASKQPRMNIATRGSARWKKYPSPTLIAPSTTPTTIVNSQGNNFRNI